MPPAPTTSARRGSVGWWPRGRGAIDHPEHIIDMVRQPPRPRTEKAERQRDQRRVARDRQAQQDLRRRTDQPDVLPVREEEGRYRP